MAFGNIIDELHGQDRLADAGTADDADLAAFDERREEVDDLDAGFQDLRFGNGEIGAFGGQFENILILELVGWKAGWIVFTA